VKIAYTHPKTTSIEMQYNCQENALKFYMGMPIETQIEIPQAAFEVSQSFAETPNTETRTEYLLMKKQEQLLEFQRNL
jgi:predicted ester cyclase